MAPTRCVGVGVCVWVCECECGCWLVRVQDGIDQVCKYGCRGGWMVVHRMASTMCVSVWVWVLVYIWKQ